MYFAKSLLNPTYQERSYSFMRKLGHVCMKKRTFTVTYLVSKVVGSYIDVILSLSKNNMSFQLNVIRVMFRIKSIEVRLTFYLDAV